MRPLSPKTGYHFFERGVGVGDGGGGSKVFAQKAPSNGEAHFCHNPGRMVTQPAAWFYVGGSNLGRLTVVGGAAVIFARPGFEPPTKKSAAGCITIRPLLAPREAVLPTAWSRVCH